MKGLLSHAKLFEVCSESSREALRVFMEEHSGMHLSSAGANGLKKGEDLTH